MIIAFFPRSLLLRLLKDPARAWHANVIVSHASLLLAAALSPLLVPMINHCPHVCLSRELFGVACPGCGITTSIAWGSRLKIADSLAANPAGMVLVVCLVWQLFLHAFALRRSAARRACNVISCYTGRCAWSIFGFVWICRLLIDSL